MTTLLAAGLSRGSTRIGAACAVLALMVLPIGVGATAASAADVVEPVPTSSPDASSSADAASGLGLTLVRADAAHAASHHSRAGNHLTYTLTASALGEVDQRDVVVTDVLPGYDADHASIATGFVSAVCKDAASVSVSCGATPFDASTHAVTAELGTIAAGSSKTVTIVVSTSARSAHASRAHRVVNQAHAASHGSDVDVASNVVTSSLVVPAAAASDVTSACTADVPSFGLSGAGFAAGESVTMDVLDKNGTLLAANYQPSNENSPVTATADANGAVAFSGVWWPGFLIDPDSDVKHFPGPNAAQISVVLRGATSSDPVVIQYPASSSGCVAGLTIVKVGDPAIDTTITSFGSDITYSMTVKALAGNVRNVQDVVVTDVLPGYGPLSSGTVSYISGSATCDATIPALGSASTCTPAYDDDAHRMTWALGDLRPGDTRKVTFTVTVDAQGLGASGDNAADFGVQNVASVDSAFTSPVESNVVTNPVLVGVPPMDDNVPDSTPQSAPSTSQDTAVLGTKLAKTGADRLLPAAALGVLLIGLGLGARRLSRAPRPEL